MLMVKKKQKINFTPKLLFRISGILLLASIVAYVAVPLFFSHIFCGAKEDQCGFNGLGIAGYALYIAMVPFLLAIVVFFAGLDRKK
jgi:hypothetical protein